MTTRDQADQSIATRFTRIMNATTSRWGMLTDPPIVAIATAPPLVAALAAARLDAPANVLLGLEVLTAAPIAVAVVTSLALLGARSNVVAWLTGLPFPVENMNAVLNGLGESLEVVFSGTVPKVAEVNAELDRVSPDTFVTQSPETPPECKPDAPPAPPEPILEIRIGVVDSKRNPAASNHQRYNRVRDVVASVLVPLSRKYPIAEVRVK